MYGMLAGALTAAVRCAASDEPMEPADILAEVLGGAFGGFVGSRLPDIVEPATSPHHRSTIHSVAVSGAVIYGGVTRATSLADRLRLAAQQAKTAARDEPEKATAHQADRVLKRFAAGAIVGLPPGFVSHTVADAGTPMGIPLLTRGF